MDTTSLRVTTQVTAGEAFFMLQGSPQKITKNDAALGKPVGATDDHLLQFELRFDHLRTYLEGFTTVINQHASLLNSLQTDVSTRLLETNLYGVVQKLGTSSHIKDKPVAALLHPMLENPKPENTGKKNEDSVNSFCNKLELFTHGFSYFNKTNNTFNERLNKVDASLAIKVNNNDMRAKVKKTRTKLRAKMEENHKNLDDKIKALEAKLTQRVDGLDKKIDEVEKHTTWRIKDCEELLRSRINDTYVDDALRLLEERLRKEIEKSTFGATDAVEKSLKELTQRLKQCETQIDDKVAGLKKSIKDIETNVTKKLDVTKFEDFRKELLAKVEANTERIRVVSTKCEPAVESLTGDMVKVNEELASLRLQLKNINAEIENLRRSGLKVSGTKETTVSVNNEEIESMLSKLNKLRDSVSTIEEQLRHKVEKDEFSRALSKKLDISEFERNMANMQNDNERIKRLIASNETLQNEIAKMEEMMDKKIAKLRKFLDLDNLLKQVRVKADEENVSKGFENTDKKISALSENLLALKRELDQAYATIEKMSIQAFSYSDNSSLTTKKINPLACLSCGNLAKNSNPLHTSMGTDGKLYKSDARDYASMQEILDTVSPLDGKSMLGKSAGLFKDGKEKTVNVTYTAYSTSVGPNSRSRPQTASTRSKGYKSPGLVSSPQAHNEYSTYRPNSAKK